MGFASRSRLVSPLAWRVGDKGRPEPRCRPSGISRVRRERAIGVVGRALDRQVEDRAGEIGDGDQVALVGRVAFLLGERVVVKLAAGENPVALERLVLVVLDPFARVLLLDLSVSHPLHLDGDRAAGRRLELGEELHRLARLGTGQRETGMNQVGNGVGRQDRLVFLGSFRAHEVLEIAVPQHDPCSEVEPPFFGVEPEASPQLFPRRVGLRPLRRPAWRRSWGLFGLKSE